jgi:flagella basal body P-ring formation protein FlgA
MACAPRAAWRPATRGLLWTALLALPPLACAQGAPGVIPPHTVAAALALARDAASAVAPSGARVEASAGALDPRLQLAPCQRVEPYLSAGSPAWGRTRVGLRCVQGGPAWNVSLPVQVHVWASAPVLLSALPAGARIEVSQLGVAEVDWGAAASPPLTTENALQGRVLARPVAAGQALRGGDLRPRQWFALGETVRIVAGGRGFTISTEGQALTPGLEGQQARVRTEGGRVLTGNPVAERRMEVAL